MNNKYGKFDKFNLAEVGNGGFYEKIRNVIEKELTDACYPNGGTSASNPYTTKYFRVIGANSETAVSDDIGFILLSPRLEPNRWYCDFGIYKQYRGNGYCKELLKLAEQYCDVYDYEQYSWTSSHRTGMILCRNGYSLINKDDANLLYIKRPLSQRNITPKCKSFIIPIEYTVRGYVTVDADSMTDAVKIVEKDFMKTLRPEERKYVEGSLICYTDENFRNW